MMIPIDVILFYLAHLCARARNPDVRKTMNRTFILFSILNIAPDRNMI